MNESQNKPNGQQPPILPQTDKKESKSTAKKGCLGCLGIIVLLGIIAAALSSSSGGPNGEWSTDKSLPRGYDNIMLKVDDSIVAAVIKIGPAMIGHSGQVSKTTQEDGGKKVIMLATVKADAKGIEGLDGRVINDALDVMITYRKGASSGEDELDYFVTGRSGDGNQTEPVLFKGLHRNK